MVYSYIWHRTGTGFCRKKFQDTLVIKTWTPLKWCNKKCLCYIIHPIQKNLTYSEHAVSKISIYPIFINRISVHYIHLWFSHLVQHVSFLIFTKYLHKKPEALVSTSWYSFKLFLEGPRQHLTEYIEISWWFDPIKSITCRKE